MNRNDDPRLGSLFTNNADGKIKIGLIGYPIDEGVIRNGGRPGAAGGPAIVRSLLNKKGSIINSEYKISLENVSIKDFGDTSICKDDLKTAHSKHQELVGQALKEGYIPIIIGGGNDQSYPNYMAFFNHHEITHLNDKTSRMLVINVDAHLDVRPVLFGNEPHSGSPFRQMLETYIEYPLDFVEFASQGSQCSSHHVEYVETKGGQIVWLKDLHGDLLCTSVDFSSTVQTFRQILNEEKYDSIFVSFDIDSIQSSDCPGVSCPAVVGLTSYEAISICYNAGHCKNVKMLDISEFNPDVESYRTGTLIVNMIYYFIMGVASRSIERNH